MQIQKHMSAAKLQGSDHVMQDTWGAYNNWAWVIDGEARTNQQQNTDVTRWVESLNSALHRAVIESPDGDLSDVLKSALNDTETDTRDWAPSTSIAIARITDGPNVETLVIGDAVAVAAGTFVRDDRQSTLTPAKPEVVSDTAVREFAGGCEVMLMTSGFAGEVKRAFGDVEQLSEALSSKMNTALPALRRAMLARDGAVEDMAVVKFGL